MTTVHLRSRRALESYLRDDALLGTELRRHGLQVAEVLVVRKLARTQPPAGRIRKGNAHLPQQHPSWLASRAHRRALHSAALLDNLSL